MIEITIPHRLPLMGQLLRMHFGQRARESHAIAWQVKAALMAKGQPLPAKPYSKARITITRYSFNEPDHDNLTASAKLLLDVLQPLSKRHPAGLGIILNDSPAHLEFVAQHCKCPRLEHRTDITIERLA